MYYTHVLIRLLARDQDTIIVLYGVRSLNINMEVQGKIVYLVASYQKYTNLKLYKIISPTDSTKMFYRTVQLCVNGRN